MRFTISSLICLLAATDGIPETWVDPIARLGATGVLGAVLLILICRTIPTMVKEFRETLDSICEQHDKWEAIRHDDQVRLEKLISDLERRNG